MGEEFSEHGGDEAEEKHARGAEEEAGDHLK